MGTERIRTDADVARAIDALCAADPRLAVVRERVPSVPLRLAPPGLEGLLRIVAGQQLSTASAAAVWSRALATLHPLTADTILAADDDVMRAAGLSRQKIATFRHVARHVADGLDLEGLVDDEPDAARDKLEAIPGIGPWTADLTLMFCCGHPDILPVGDLAIRRAAQRALLVADELAPASLAAIGEAWSPWRSSAARLLWAYYRVDRAPAATTAKAAAAPLVPAGYPL